jgi:hypothetical protein
MRDAPPFVPEARGSAGSAKKVAPVGLPGGFGRRDRAGVVGSGQYGIDCHARNVVIDMRDAVLGQDVRSHSHRRLSDWVLITFHFACDEGGLEAAEQLIAIL